jgi:ubiquinone/menaquinone biosynthesis C-methylase UbiE
MDYNNNLWNDYTDENVSPEENPSEFIYHISLGLGAKNILEAGCNRGNNLSAFPSNFDVHGFDLNEHAIEISKKKYPNFKFKIGSVTQIPYENNSFDLVFSRTVLIHIHEKMMDQVMNEMLRVTKKYIFNIEFFGENEEMIQWKRGDDLLWKRNMVKRWKKFPVRVISDVNIPKELDPNNVRFTLIEKL